MRGRGLCEVGGIDCGGEECIVLNITIGLG